MIAFKSSPMVDDVSFTSALIVGKSSLDSMINNDVISKKNN